MNLSIIRKLAMIRVGNLGGEDDVLGKEWDMEIGKFAIWKKNVGSKCVYTKKLMVKER